MDIFLISLEKGAERYFFFFCVKKTFAHFDLEFYMYVALLIKKKKKNVRTRVMCGVKGDKLKNTQDTHVSAT